jgi:hypothetical protein
VNIDPGLLNEHQLIMASTKLRSHRIYMDRGIYADLMLLHTASGYTALPWTYPDYGEQGQRELFARLRRLYLAIRRMTPSETHPSPQEA